MNTIKVALLLTNLNLDFASGHVSFRLVSQSGFRFLFHLTKLLFDRKNLLDHR